MKKKAVVKKAKPARVRPQTISNAVKTFWVFITTKKKLGAKESTGTLAGYCLPQDVVNATVVRITARSEKEAIEYYCKKEPFLIKHYIERN